ncbi:MAG: hypothetical protein OXI67_12380 [Candidatus Poribacteria bacterium]|nr:hypothetical protein [Candidatus Poribacteria bacterium]
MKPYGLSWKGLFDYEPHLQRFGNYTYRNIFLNFIMVMEQIVRGTASSNPGVLASEHRENTEASMTETKRGCPRGA